MHHQKDKESTKQTLLADLEQARLKLRQFPNSARIPRLVASIQAKLDIIDGKRMSHKNPTPYVLEKSTYWKQRQEINRLKNEVEALSVTIEILKGGDLAQKHAELLMQHELLLKELAAIATLINESGPTT